MGVTPAVSTLQHAIHRYFIWLIVGSYVLAAFFPGLGLLIRSAELGAVSLPQGRIAVSLPPLMLAFLLFNAGLGVRTADLSSLLRKPWLLIAGSATNVAAPLAFIAGVNLLLSFWANPDETQQILTGLALVASMPIAGASTAWAQNANGNLALSLGLILLSTLASPIISPLALHAGGFLTTGDYSEDLHELAQSSAGSFLAVWVILPSLLGIATHKILGGRRTASLSPYTKIANFLVLSAICYRIAPSSSPWSGRCLSLRCTDYSSRARTAIAPRGWRITTLPARKVSTCIISIAPWPGSARSWRRRARTRSRHAASRM